MTEAKVSEQYHYLIVRGKGPIATTHTPKSLAKAWEIKKKDVIELRIVEKKVN